MREVAVIGIGETAFGELWDKSFRDLGIEAGLMAVEDSGITAQDLDAVYVGNMSAGKFIDQEHVSALVADYSGLADQHLPTVRIEGGGACGAIAILQAAMAIGSGLHDIVIVGGAEKMTDVADARAGEILSATADQEWETVFGATFAGLYAMMARRHMYEHGTTREQMAQVAVKNHKNGSLNPNAQFQKEITLDTVLKSGWIAEPLTVFDSAPLSDGAAAVVLCAMDRAEREGLREHVRRAEGPRAARGGRGDRAGRGGRASAPRGSRQAAGPERGGRVDAHPRRDGGDRGRPPLREGELRWRSRGSGGRSGAGITCTGRSAGTAGPWTSRPGPCARSAGGGVSGRWSG